MKTRDLSLVLVLGGLGILVLVGTGILTRSRYRELPKAKTRHGYSGDGVYQDNGPFSFPRFVIRFPKLSLADMSAGEFTLSGVPSAPLTLELVLVSMPNTGLLSVSIVDEQNAPLYEHSAPVNKWVHKQGMGESSLWHPSLRDIVLPSNRQLKMRISFEAFEKERLSFVVHPRLSGGGVEGL